MWSPKNKRPFRACVNHRFECASGGNWITPLVNRWRLRKEIDLGFRVMAGRVLRYSRVQLSTFLKFTVPLGGTMGKHFFLLSSILHKWRHLQYRGGEKQACVLITLWVLTLVWHSFAALHWSLFLVPEPCQIQDGSDGNQSTNIYNLSCMRCGTSNPTTLYSFFFFVSKSDGLLPTSDCLERSCLFFLGGVDVWTTNMQWQKVVVNSRVELGSKLCSQAIPH